MNITFAGTPPFAATALNAICEAGHTVSLVLTQPDRPSGRGKALQASAVKQLAMSRGLTVFQPATLKISSHHETLREQHADVMVVAAYGLILPQAVLDLPRYGCLNIHGSLLPRWRGAAPIHRAIQAGDTQTGVAIMQMEAGLDTGAILAERAVEISAGATTAVLHDQLASLGAELLVTVLSAVEQSGGTLPVARPQPEVGVTYASKIDKSEALINWRNSAVFVERTIRAFDPFPGTAMRLASKPEEVIKIWSARCLDSSISPFQTSAPSAGDVHIVLPTRQLFVACGDGWLEILLMQRPGGKRIATALWLQSYLQNTSPLQRDYAIYE